MSEQMSTQMSTQSASTWVIDQIDGGWATLRPGATSLGIGSHENESGSELGSDAQRNELQELNLPRVLLPHGASEGDVIHLALTVDAEQTERARAEVSALLDELTAGDDGADFDL